MTVSRKQIIDTMKAALQKPDYILAAWLGGSDATGRTDEISDIDMQIIVEDDRVEDAFSLTHKAVETLSPILHRYRFPEPTWHGHSQELLRLRDADPNHFLDFVVMKKSTQDRFLEKERHGSALVLFDRENLLIPPPFDWKTHTQKMTKRLADLHAQFPLFQPVVTRGVRRGHIVESAYAYQAWCEAAGVAETSGRPFRVGDRGARQRGLGAPGPGTSRGGVDAPDRLGVSQHT